AHHPAVDARLEVEVELVERLDPGKPRELEPRFDAAQLTAPPLGLERLAEETPQIELLLGGVLADAVELRRQVLHPHSLEQRHELHDATSSYTARSRRSTRSTSRQSAAWYSGTCTQPSEIGRSVCVATARSPSYTCSTPSSVIRTGTTCPARDD